MMFTDEEALALALGLLSARRLGLSGVAPAVEGALEEAREQVPAIGVFLEEAEGGVLMRSSTSDLGWMARVLSGISFPFLVKGPPELREALRRHAAEISRQAERAR